MYVRGCGQIRIDVGVSVMDGSGGVGSQLGVRDFSFCTSSYAPSTKSVKRTKSFVLLTYSRGRGSDIPDL